MKRVGVILASVLLASAVPAAGQGLCNGGDIDANELDACKAKSLDAALGALATKGWTGAYTHEALAALGLDPSRHPAGAPAYGTLHVPENDALAPKANIRALSAAARTGHDPTSYPDPERGATDLRQQLADKEAQALSFPDDSVVAFQLLGMHGAGMGGLGNLASRLKSMQDPDGGWSCGQGVPSVGCTGFAASALAAAGALDDATAESAAAFVEGRENTDGGYGLSSQFPESNGDSTAWALVVLQLAGEAGPLEAWAYLLALQNGDGTFRYKPESGNVNALTTMAALTALAGGHPGAAYEDFVVTVPSSIHVGQAATLDAGDATTATWNISERLLHGAVAQWEPVSPGPVAVHVAARGDGTLEFETHSMDVRNDPPTFASLPDRITTDRVQGIAFDAGATDPEGFPVEVGWTLGGATGSGTVDTLPATVGKHVLELEARDPHGGVAARSLDVVVENLRPAIDHVEAPATFEPGQEFEVSVQATDPDGDPLAFAWTFESAEHTQGLDAAWGFLSLPTGDYDVDLVVTDAHGDAVAWSGSLLVAQDAPAVVAPAFTTAEVVVDGRDLTVHVTASPEGASVTARWQAGGTVGLIPLTQGQGAVVVPDDVDALESVLVRARHDGLTVERSWGPFVLAPPPAPSDQEESADAEDAQEELQEDGKTTSSTSRSEAVRAEDQESPLGFLVPLLSLAAALGRRARRAPRRRRTAPRS